MELFKYELKGKTSVYCGTGAEQTSYLTLTFRTKRNVVVVGDRKSFRSKFLPQPFSAKYWRRKRKGQRERKKEAEEQWR